MKKMFVALLIGYSACGWSDPVDGSVLTPASASALTQDQCASLRNAQQIPLDAVASLPNYCVNNMGLYLSTPQLSELSPSQISSLSINWLRAVGQSRALVLLPKAPALSVFKMLSLKLLPADQINALSPDQLNGLTAAQFGLFDTSYYKAMSLEQMAYLRSDQISAAFDKWTDSQMRGLTPAQITGLPPSQTNGLTSYFTSWTAAQVQALTPAQLNMVSAVFGYPWFKTVYPKLSMEQLSGISVAALKGLAANGLFSKSGRESCAADSQLTEEKTSVLTDFENTVCNAQFPSQNLSPDIIPLLSDDIGCAHICSSAFFQHLTPAQVAKFTPQQTANFSSSAAVSSEGLIALMQANFMAWANLSGLGGSVVAEAVPANKVALLTHAQAEALLVHGSLWLRPATLQSFSPSVFSAISAENLVAVMNLMSAKAEYLTVEQIEAIAAVNKNAFTDNNKKVFSAAQLAAATGE